MDPLQCVLCQQTLCLPLLYPCGHSGACSACVFVLSPPRRNCPVCGVRSKTLPKRPIVNRTLDAVLRHVRPNDFDGRASALDSTYDVLLHALLQLARAKADFYADDLPGWYLSQYEAVVQRHMEGATTCRCGLFCVPKGKIGTNRLYYGCPRWKPAQNKDVPPVHCGFWRWLSAAENRTEEKE